MKKLLTLNVEGDKHLDLVRAFIKREDPDIICLQELYKSDTETLLGSTYRAEFLGMCLRTKQDGAKDEWGSAIATKIPLRNVVREYYFQPTTRFVDIDITDIEAKRKTLWQGLIGGTIDDDGKPLRVFTTHFTWTPHGYMAHPYQATDLKTMLTYLSEEEPHIICGDFNIPRKQNALYPILHAHYTDTVPEEYITSLHLPLHKTKDHPIEGPAVASYMVDYIFSSPNVYTVKEVRMECGMSDHCALLAHIEKMPS